MIFSVWVSSVTDCADQIPAISPLVHWCGRTRLDREDLSISIVLEFASEDLRADRDIVLAAVTQNGYALQFACDELRADVGVVQATIKSRGKAVTYARYRLKGEVAPHWPLQQVPQSEHELLAATCSIFFNEATIS